MPKLCADLAPRAGSKCVSELKQALVNSKVLRRRNCFHPLLAFSPPSAALFPEWLAAGDKDINVVKLNPAHAQISTDGFKVQSLKKPAIFRQKDRLHTYCYGK
jgi:hypothetical protein